MSSSRAFTMRSQEGDIVVPRIGYGTITESSDGFSSMICEALKAGIRHLDCAWEYGVNQEIGEGIALSGIPREDIFITHKINPHFYRPADVSICMNQILDEMKLGYVDLLLLHLPVALKPLPHIETAKAFIGSSLDERRIDIADDKTWIVDGIHSTKDIAAANGTSGSIVPTWKAMQDLVLNGKARAVGVSNFSIKQLEEILHAAPHHNPDVPLSANEIEIHPYHPNLNLRKFMKQHNILALGHSSFATCKWLYDPTTGDWPTEELIPPSRGCSLLENPTIKSIAERSDMSIGQVIHSWAVQNDVIPLGRSTNVKRIRQNLDVRPLSKADMEEIDSLECSGTEGQGLVLANVFPGIEFPC